MDNKIVMDCILHEHRNTESWVIKTAGVASEALEEMLVGVHLNICDYFGQYPLLVFNIEHRPQRGKVFQNVYLLDVQDVPEENVSFLANGHFLRQCLEKGVKDPKSEEIYPMHTLDGIQLLFESPESYALLAGIQKSHNCFLIGVYGTPNPIHFSRGFGDDSENETDETRQAAA